MALVNSLLTAIVRADGDALVLHVGERPYVVGVEGNVDLSNSVLTLDIVLGMLAQLLPQDLLNSLSNLGAVEHQLQPPSPMRDAFTVVAARGGDDIWIEIRRKRALVTFATPEVTKAPEAVKAPEVPHVAAEPAPTSEVVEAPEGINVPEAATVPEPADVPAEINEPMPLGASELLVVEETATVSETPKEPDVVEESEPEFAGVVEMAKASEVVESTERHTVPEEEQVPAVEQVAAAVAVVKISEPIAATAAMPEPAAASVSETVSAVAQAPEAFPPVPKMPDPVPAAAQVPEAARSMPRAVEEPPVAAPEAVHHATPAAVREHLDNVVPLTRVIRVEVPPRHNPSGETTLERLLNLAATRGASVLYLTSQSRPYLRVEGEMCVIDSEPTFAAADIDAIVFDLMPEAAREAYGRGEPVEWTSEFDGIGRTRCATFKDQRGPGVIFQLSSTRPISAEQLGLAREIQALATESEGLVVVAGPRGGDKSTLVAALVDVINRQLSGSVITIEQQIRIVHDNQMSLVSQREVRGAGADAVAMVRAALRENPDVLVLEDMNAPEVMQLALEAAGNGVLVFLTATAGSTMSALTRIVDAFPPEARKSAQAALAERLRGAVSQVVLRKARGGRIAARELLLTSPAVASLIADGQFAQLAVAIDNGRKHGMVSLNDVLLSLVNNGTVDVSEAYRKADNRAALLTLLKRDGIDIWPLERLA